MPDMLCPWQGQGEDCHLKVGTLKWMTDNTGPTDQGHSSKPCTSSGNGRGKLEAGFLSGSPCLETQPSGIQDKLPLPKPTSCPVSLLPALPSRTFSFVPNPLKEVPRSTRQRPAKQRAEQVQVILSLTRGWILTEALRHVDRQYPTGNHNSKKSGKYGRTHQKGEGWIPLMPSITGHLKHIFLSQPAKGSLQLNTEKRHSQANTHQSQ